MRLHHSPTVSAASNTTLDVCPHSVLPAFTKLNCPPWNSIFDIEQCIACIMACEACDQTSPQVTYSITNGPGRRAHLSTLEPPWNTLELSSWDLSGKVSGLLSLELSWLSTPAAFEISFGQKSLSLAWHDSTTRFNISLVLSNISYCCSSSHSCELIKRQQEYVSFGFKEGWSLALLVS